MSTPAPPIGNNPETGGQPENLTTQIEKVITNAVDVSKKLQDTVVTSASKTNLFSRHVAKDVRACLDTYVDLMALAKSTATDARVKALKSFSSYTKKIRERTDNQMVQTFDYLLKDLKPGSDKFETKDGKTFDSVASDLKKVAQTIGDEGKEKLEKANTKALAAGAALDAAEEQYAASKAEYEAQLPGWLAELGLDDNVPKWLMLALYVPFDFLRRLAGLGSTHASTFSQIKALINKINKEKAVVDVARKKLQDALAEVDSKEQDADAILEYQTTIKTLAADVGDLASKLNVFKSVFEMVKKDCENFRAKYKLLEEGKADVNKDALINDVLAEATLFDEMGNGLMKFEVTA